MDTLILNLTNQSGDRLSFTGGKLGRLPSTDWGKWPPPRTGNWIQPWTRFQLSMVISWGHRLHQC